jgi:hypothetical protein
MNITLSRKCWITYYLSHLLVISVLVVIIACNNEKAIIKDNVILDTDANNELDDQHAIAYLLFNGKHFNVKGITVNRTISGGSIEKHTEEAERVVELCGLKNIVPVYKGASSVFDSISQQLDNDKYDGFEAVSFIVEQARKPAEGKLVVVAVGKLTNIALALAKAPEIEQKIKVVWLGSNYPKPGEYNQVDDEPALNFILNSNVEFEIVLVRAKEKSGTYAVTASLYDIQKNMPGKGPQLQNPVKGRKGGHFYNFGDYSLNLWYTRYDFYEWEHPALALFDVCAIAMLKNHEWAEPRIIPAPILNENGEWIERPDNQRRVAIWENFNRDAIIGDFFTTMKNYQLVKTNEE